jgi:DNA-binding XRE family transcriptional regulator
VTDLKLHHAITQSLRAQREERERRQAMRALLGQQLGITESEAEQILGFWEIACVDRTLKDACDQWAATLEVDGAAIKSQLDFAVNARSDAASTWREAAFLLTQHFHCKQIEADGVLQFLETAASGGLFRDIALRWVRTLGVDWRSLVAAVIGRESELLADLKATQAFGQVFKALRDQKRMSAEELSERAEIDLEQLREMETGVVDPTIVDICKLAQAFDMKPSELVYSLEEATPWLRMEDQNHGQRQI